MNQKYAVVLEMLNEPFIGRYMANCRRPYIVKEGDEKRVRQALQNWLPRAKIIIADRETILNNPFDILEDDFKEPLTI